MIHLNNLTVFFPILLCGTLYLGFSSLAVAAAAVVVETTTIPNDVNAIRQVQQQGKYRKLVDVTPLVGAVFTTSTLSILKETATKTVNSLDSSVFGNGIDFQLSPTSNFVNFDISFDLPVLNKFQNDSIIIEVKRDVTNPLNSILNNIGITDIGAIIPKISLKGTGSLTTPIPITFDCYVNWTNVPVNIPPPTGIVMIVNVTGSGTTLRGSAAAAATFSTVNFPLSDPTYYKITGDPNCDTLKNQMIETIIIAEANAKTSLSNLLKGDALLNQITKSFVNLELSIANFTSFTVGNGTMDLKASIETFGVTENNQLVQMSLSAAPEASIINGTRRGSKYKPEVKAGNAIELPTILPPGISFKSILPLEGMNSVIAGIFYLLWNDFTADSNTPSDSVACEPVNRVDDPCPFPPLELYTLQRKADSIPLKFAFLGLRRLFRRGGFYDSFKINVVLQPPELTFSDVGIGGSVIASVYLQAQKRFLFGDNFRDLVKIDFPLSFEVNVPTITPEGNLEGVVINKLEIGKRKDGLDFDYYQPLPFRPTIRGRITLRYIILPLLRRNLERFYGIINNAIEPAIANFAIPLKLDRIILGEIVLEPALSNVVLDVDKVALSVSATISL